MSRNFGVRRNMLGKEMFHDFWHANDNEPETRLPVYATVAALILIFAVGMWTR